MKIHILKFFETLVDGNWHTQEELIKLSRSSKSNIRRLLKLLKEHDLIEFTSPARAGTRGNVNLLYRIKRITPRIDFLLKGNSDD